CDAMFLSGRRNPPRYLHRFSMISHVGYNPDITLFLCQARESGLCFKMLVGNGAGYSQLDKLPATFDKDVDNFCNIDPVPAQLLDPKILAPGSASSSISGRALQGQNLRRTAPWASTRPGSC